MANSTENDLKNHWVKKNSVTLAVKTADVTGVACDMITGDGRCYARVTTGTVHADTTGVISVLESDSSGSGFVAISGATATLDTTDNTAYEILFNRSKRYVRIDIDFSGTTISAGVDGWVWERVKSSG